MRERTPGSKIRVILADTSEFTLIGLKQVLASEPDIEIVATCDDGEDLVARTTELEPDVVVAEIDLPRLSGDKAAQRIRRDQPHVAVVILAARDEEQDLFDAIRGGAAAYLPKDCDAEELLESIRRVNDGTFLINEMVYSRPNVATRVLAEFRDLSVYGPGASRVFAPLSPREVQILDQISQGKTNKEVAYALAISEQTVKNHMSSILRKLSVNDRTQAVVYAMRQGWIKGPEVRSER
ncbi:MAG: LuxR C-terminal-related transcriptional regulator [Candidatus Limnocylindria bacterium]